MIAARSRPATDEHPSGPLADLGACPHPALPVVRGPRPCHWCPALGLAGRARTRPCRSCADPALPVVRGPGPAGRARSRPCSSLQDKRAEPLTGRAAHQPGAEACSSLQDKRAEPVTGRAGLVRWEEHQRLGRARPPRQGRFGALGRTAGAAGKNTSGRAGRDRPGRAGLVRWEEHQRPLGRTPAAGQAQAPGQPSPLIESRRLNSSRRSRQAPAARSTWRTSHGSTRLESSTVIVTPSTPSARTIPEPFR